MRKSWLLALIGAVTSVRNGVLAVGLCSIAAITVPGLPFRDVHWLDIILWLCLAFFALDWALNLRTWSKTKPPRPSLLSFDYLVHALAVVPVPLAHAMGISPATSWLLGVLWLLKVPATLSGFSLLRRVFVLEAKPLGSVVVLFLFVLFTSAVVMHLAERDAQPLVYGTLPSTLYWAVTTLTTTGYGDVVPITALGRMTAGVVMICGLAVFGLWTGIIATGFSSETRRRDFVRTWESVASVPFFKPLGPAAIIEITRMLRSQDVSERTVIVRKGRSGDCMYFIASGQVEIVGTNPIVRLGAGAFFGELAILGDGVRTATVVATEPTNLLILDLQDYRIFAAQHPELARAVEEEAARRIAERRAAQLKKGDSPPAQSETPAKEVATSDQT